MAWKSGSMSNVMGQFMNKLIYISLFTLYNTKDMPLIIAYNKQAKNTNN